MRLMTEMCTFTVDREATLISYLYDDIDPGTRATFDAHLATCGVCRNEIHSLRGVRGKLAGWSVASLQSSVVSPQFLIPSPQSLGPSPQFPIPAPGSFWRDIPAWAQVAAAALFIGVAGGIANLDVRYDAAGLSVRTGWSKPVGPAPAANPSATNAAAPEVSRGDLVALEQQLRTEMRAIEANARSAASADAQPVRVSADADVLRRTRALVDDAEKRQQRELALRIGEVLRDVNAQRQADLGKIDRSLGLVQNNLGVEVLKQRQQVNYLMRVNQRQ